AWAAAIPPKPPPTMMIRGSGVVVAEFESMIKSSEVGRPCCLVETLVVSLDADFAGVSSRDENEISGRQGESDRPPDRGVGQRIGAGGDIVSAERVFGRMRRMQHDWKNRGSPGGQQAGQQQIRPDEGKHFTPRGQSPNQHARRDTDQEQPEPPTRV